MSEVAQFNCLAVVFRVHKSDEHQ